MTKFTALITTCCLSLVSVTALDAVACDNDKKSACSAHPQAALKVVSTDGSGCQATAKAAQAKLVSAKTCDVNSDCPATRTVALVTRAVEKIDSCCGTECPARADLVAAVQTLAKAKPGLVSEVQLTKLSATPSSCSAKAAAAVASVKTDGDGCCASATRATALTVATKGDSQCSSQKAATALKIATDDSQCSSQKAATALNVATGDSQCSSQKAATALKVASGDSQCSSQKAATVLKVATDDSQCSSQKAATVLKVATDDSQCSSQKAATVALKVATDDSQCSSQKAATALKVASGDSQCSSQKAATALKVATDDSQCSAHKNARFVAFGCDKTDRLARAAAKAYLQLVNEMKLVAGAEGCSAQAASDVLAAVLKDMQAEQGATADAKTLDTDAALSVKTSTAVKSGCCASQK